jgi:hypothetical protein
MEKIVRDVLNASRMAFEIVRNNFEATFDAAIFEMLEDCQEGQVPCMAEALREIIEAAIRCDNFDIEDWDESTRDEIERAAGVLGLIKAVSDLESTHEAEKIFSRALVDEIVDAASQRAQRLSAIAPSLRG